MIDVYSSEFLVAYDHLADTVANDVKSRICYGLNGWFLYTFQYADAVNCIPAIALAIRRPLTCLSGPFVI